MVSITQEVTIMGKHEGIKADKIFVMQFFSDTLSEHEAFAKAALWLTETSATLVGTNVYYDWDEGEFILTLVCDD